MLIQGLCIGFLDRPDFEQNYKRAFEVLVTTSHVFRHIPILRHSVNLMPALGPYLGPDIAYMVKSMNETIPNHIIKAQQQKPGGARRVFTEIMNSPIPNEHKTIYRLSGEGWGLVAAGSETTAVSTCQASRTHCSTVLTYSCQASLTLITWFLLSGPEKLARLREELKHEDPQKLSWVQLEKYPYLHGVIFEALRVGMGIPGRLPRIARDEDLVYKNRGFNYVVPRGTAIGMSAFVNHFDPNLFPEPEKYEPERWIDADGKPNNAMEKYILSFSKGHRQCIGMK
jgi:hypothetical protein